MMRGHETVEVMDRDGIRRTRVVGAVVDDRLGPDERLTSRYVATPETMAQHRIEIVDMVERNFWQFVASEHVVLTEVPVTTVEERAVDLSAHIDQQLPQPYGYEPPTEHVILVVAMGRKVRP